MKKKPNHIRIIGGQWKRSVVEIPIATGLRPTPSRVRETLFNCEVLFSDMSFVNEFTVNQFIIEHFGFFMKVENGV